MLQYAKSSKGLFIKSEKTDKSVFGNVMLWRLSDDRRVTVFAKDGPSEIYDIIFETHFDKKSNLMGFNVANDRSIAIIYPDVLTERAPADTILVTGKNASDDEKIDLWLVAKDTGKPSKLTTISRHASISIVSASREIAIIDIEEKGTYTTQKFKY